MLEIPVSGKTLELSYGYRVIQLSTPASGFAGVMADATANGGKRIALSDGISCLQVFAGRNMGNIFWNIDAYRTGVLAR